MTQTILVPVDISHQERFDGMISAVKRIYEEGDRVIALHVVEDAPAFIRSQIPEHLSENNRKQARESLEKLAATAGIPIEPKVVEGHAATAILEAAGDEKVSTIVIGSHKPGWEDYLIGSTAARVVRHAACSVYVIR
jgi:nucleotide-binding universal stress UspA family protein